MVTEADTHIRRERIGQERIDSRAHGVEFRAARGDRVTHRARNIAEEVKIGDSARRAGTILTNSVAGFVATSTMRRIRHRIDALATAIGLSVWTNARAIQTSCSHGAGHVASSAMLRIIHRIHAAHATGRPETRAERIGAGISAGAGFVAAAAIHRIRLRIHTRAIARGRSTRTNALSVHTRCRARTRIVAHTAMLVARHLVNAIRAACIRRRTRACSGLTHGQTRTRRVFIKHSIAVVVLPVAFFHGAGEGIGHTVVAIHSATNNGRLAVFVLVERRRNAY